MQKLKKVIILIGVVIIASAAVLGYYYIPSSNISVKTYEGKKVRLYYNNDNIAVYDGYKYEDLTYRKYTASKERGQIEIKKDDDIVLEALIPTGMETKYLGAYIILFKDGIMKYVISDGGFAVSEYSPVDNSKAEPNYIYCEMYGNRKEKTKKLTKKEFDYIVDQLNGVEKKFLSKDNFEDFYEYFGEDAEGFCYDGKTFNSEPVLNLLPELRLSSAGEEEINSVLDSLDCYKKIMLYLSKATKIRDKRFSPDRWPF